MSKNNSSSEPKIAGIAAYFDTPAELIKASEAIRDKGYRKWDTHTPFPVHGIDKAMGIKQSPLGWIVLLGGLAGFSAGLGLQWWGNAYSYQYVISGKPFFSYQAFVPITFELSILFAAFAAVFGMFALNGLPRLYHALFNYSKIHTFSDAGFVVSIEAADPQFEPKQTADFLNELGGKHVEVYVE